METKSIETIKYKGKDFDKGIVLGTRKYRWCLKRQYEPCWAKNGDFISQLSPHKTNFFVYILLADLKNCVGEEIIIVQKRSTWLLKVIEVNDSILNYEIMARD